MQTHSYDGCVHALRKWAVNRRDDPPEPYRSWIRDLLTQDHELKSIGYWVGVISPETPLADNGIWAKGYPHKHQISVGWSKRTMTATTCLSAADDGGAFGLGGLLETDPYEFVNASPGMTIVVDAETWHGVMPVLSGTRMTLIASGPPADD